MNLTQAPISKESPRRMNFYLTIPIDPSVTAPFDRLKENVPEIRDTSFRNPHLTLGYYPNIPESLARPIAAALEDVRFHSFGVTLKGLRRYLHKKTHHPCFLWVGLKHNVHFNALRQRLDSIVRKIAGLPSEKNKFSPHVGLARLSGAPPSPELVKLLEDYSLHKFAACQAKSFAFVETSPQEGEPQLIRHATVRLVDAPPKPARRRPLSPKARVAPARPARPAAPSAAQLARVAAGYAPDAGEAPASGFPASRPRDPRQNRGKRKDRRELVLDGPRRPY
ncbi:MAG: RNA 2',3'-cyclic phosphodiesterase [Deltaproteobacteria bacterium]|jgi:2'-5' RNA ligase|nr:RNA 2',3'-cyclic phosphodiesterase [Deltaproteobacteria bacterium]